MPFPRPTDPDYCEGSDTPVEDFDDEHEWFRCPRCGRLIRPRPRQRTFFPHVSNRARTRAGDDVRETLDAHGQNRRERRTEEG
jgi:hypothetical protein